MPAFHSWRVKLGVPASFLTPAFCQHRQTLGSSGWQLRLLPPMWEAWVSLSALGFGPGQPQNCSGHLGSESADGRSLWLSPSVANKKEQTQLANWHLKEMISFPSYWRNTNENCMEILPKSSENSHNTDKWKLTYHMTQPTTPGNISKWHKTCIQENNL